MEDESTNESASEDRKYLVYIIRLEYNLFYLRDLQVSLRGKEEEKKKWR